jgi:HJR/Mrr/RecB family endonuclease
MNSAQEETDIQNQLIWRYPPLALLDSVSPNHSALLSSVLINFHSSNVKSKLALTLGVDMSGKSVFSDLRVMKHCLIAGTADDKSTFLKSLIASLLFIDSPDEVKFILIDLKGNELSIFQEIPHLLTPVIKEPEKILSAMKWITAELDRRMKLFSQVNASDIDSYNKMQGFQALPYIVICIEELSNLKLISYGYEDIEEILQQISIKGNLGGIHLVATSQKPNRNLVGLFPGRIVFKLTSDAESHLLLNKPGAEKLSDEDMLYIEPKMLAPICVQAITINQIELARVKNYLINDAAMTEKQASESKQYPTYSTSNSSDEEYQEFLESNEGIIDKFCEIAARKVSVIDEYGDENWAILESEKQRCFVKITTKLGISEKFLDNVFLKIENDEVGGHGLDNAISYLGQSLRVALSNIDSEIVHYSFFLVKLYFSDLENIFRDKYKVYKSQPKKSFDYTDVSGIDFEVLIGKELAEAGFDITGTPKTGDQGADIIATKNKKKYVIQTKRYTGLVGNKAVQEVIAAKSYYKGDVAVAITNSKFTPSARDLAQKSDVILIDGDALTDIEKLLKQP